MKLYKSVNSQGHRSLSDATLDDLKAALVEFGVVALSRNTAAYLLELVERLEDEGPEGSGWKRQKLICAIAELKGSEHEQI